MSKAIHINADLDDVSEIVLMPGDPLRAKYIAENFLENAKEICNLRNMLGFTGYYHGVRLSVIAHGMGMPSIGIYAYELFKFYNVQKVIRIGTCGVTKPEIKIPDLVLAKRSYTESNFALSFNSEDVHIAYPSNNLNNQILATAKELNYSIHVGDVVTMDVFGPYVDVDKIYARSPKEIDVIAEEMESFALFYLANYFQREASCILTAVDSKYSSTVLSSEMREKGLNDMIKLALETIIK